MKPHHTAEVLQFQARSVPITAILEHYHLLGDFKRIGAQLFACCPIHGGSHKKQFVVDPDNGLWRCFGDCNRGGGTLQLVQELEKVSLSQAARLVSQWFALTPASTVQKHRKPKERAMSNETNQPTHRVYSAKRREGAEKDDLTMIGSGWIFNTKSGKAGMNIQLNAMPIGDRIVVFERDADWEAKHWKQPEEEKDNGKSLKKK